MGVEQTPSSATANQGAAGSARWPVADKDATLEVLPDQSGADGVLTFTFSAASAPWVSVNSGDPVRVTTTQTPAANFGIPVEAGSPFPIPTVTDAIKVYAATGQTVTVYGTR